MSTIFDQINEIPIIDILDKIWVSYKIVWNELQLFDDWKMTDWWRWDIVKWFITDFSGKRSTWDRITFLMAHFNKEKWEIVNWLKTNFNLIDDATPQQKQQKRETFIESMPDHNTLNILRRFLLFRGFQNDQIQNIDDLAKELGSYSNMFVWDDIKKDTLLFPMYKKWKRVWIKMRTVDGTLFGSMKSWNIKWWHTGLIYKDLTDTIIIVEWEPDYLCMKVLGYTSVIWNLGGVWSNKNELRDLCKHAKNIIVAYDNDAAWKMNAESLDFGRPHKIVQFPDWVNDINDLVRMWWQKSDFDSLFEKEWSPINEPPKLFGNRFFYNRITTSFYDVIGMKKAEIKDISYDTKITTKMINEIIMSNKIPSYDGMCYRKWWVKNKYNLFDESTLSKVWDTPEIHPMIERLLTNLCNGNLENLEWLMEAIWYKYTHINDSRVPAVLFWWVGSSGKWLFMKLMTTIFWKDNIQFGLGQEHIESAFSAYTWQKIVVELNELSNNDEAKWKRNIEKLKTMIFEERVVVNKKFEQPYEIDNIAWFIMSSNNANALHLDSSEKWNRRFSIIHTGNAINPDLGKQIEEAITDPVIAWNFLAYLSNQYSETTNKKYFLALDNQDKKDLEDSNRPMGLDILDWIEEKYPNVKKIRVEDMNSLISEYEFLTWENLGYKDQKFYRFLRRDWNGRCEKKTIDFRGKKEKGYYINKEVEGDGIYSSL